MSRKILFKASLTLMATPLISMVATPAFSTSIYSQQQLLSGLGSVSNSQHSKLIADWYNQDRNYNQDRHGKNRSRRHDIWNRNQDYGKNHDLRDENYDRSNQDQDYDRHNQDQNYNRHNQDQNYDRYNQDQGYDRHNQGQGYDRQNRLEAPQPPPAPPVPNVHVPRQRPY